jgi:hypothetical protein
MTALKRLRRLALLIFKFWLLKLSMVELAIMGEWGVGSGEWGMGNGEWG